MRTAKLALATILFVMSGTASAVWIDGYTRPDGVYVEGHWRDDPKDYAKEDRERRQEQQRRSSQDDHKRQTQDPYKGLYEPPEYPPRY